MTKDVMALVLERISGVDVDPESFTHTQLEEMVEKAVATEDKGPLPAEAEELVSALGIERMISRATMYYIRVVGVTTGVHVWIEKEYYRKTPRMGELMALIGAKARSLGYRTAFNKPPHGEAYLWIGK